MWCCSVVVMDLLLGRYDVVHTFYPPSDCYIPGSCMVSASYGVTGIYSTVIGET